MRPLRDRILVHPDDPEEVSAGGIVLLAKNIRSHESVPTITGEVREVGSEVTGVSRGERVLFTNWEDMHVQDEQYMLIREADILGVIDA